MKHIFLLMAAVLIVEATGLHAEDQRGTEQNPIKLDDSIAVTANRAPTPLSEIASSITVITKEEIERSQTAFVTHLLKNVPGLDVVQSGGEGKQTSLFIRGANSHHTLVLLDGIPLNDPSSPNNAVDLSNLLTNNIERIEILRGPQSVLYGPEAIGGVVQLFTKSGTGRNNISVNSEAGSNSRYDIGATFDGYLRKMSYSLSAKRLKTDGVSAAFDSPENDGYENNSISSRLDYAVSPTMRLNLSARYIDSESDLDKTTVIFDDPNYFSTQREQQYNFRFFHKARNLNWQQQLQLYFSKIDRTTHDDFDQDHPGDSQFTDSQGKRIGFSFQQSYHINRRHSVIMGLETERASFSSNLFFRSSFGDFTSNVGGKNTWTRGIFLFDQVQFEERLCLTFGGRLDEHKQFGTTGTYRFTAAYHFEKSGTRFRGVIGTGYKAPSVYQLYHPSVFIGNPDLLPEKSQSWEIGIDQDIIRNTFSASITFFSNEFKDLIVGVENVARAESNGIESSLEYNNSRFKSRLDYVYTDSKDKSTKDKLIRRPTHSVNWTNTLEATDRLSLVLTAKFTGKRFDQDFSQFPAPRVELDEYTVVDLAASLQVNEHLMVKGRLDNLFDEDYQEIYGYGHLPISAYFGVQLTN